MNDYHLSELLTPEELARAESYAQPLLEEAVRQYERSIITIRREALRFVLLDQKPTLSGWDTSLPTTPDFTAIVEVNTNGLVVHEEIAQDQPSTAPAESAEEPSPAKEALAEPTPAPQQSIGKLTSPQMAEAIGVSISALYDYEKRGLISRIVVGRQLFWDEAGVAKSKAWQKEHANLRAGKPKNAGASAHASTATAQASPAIDAKPQETLPRFPSCSSIVAVPTDFTDAIRAWKQLFSDGFKIAIDPDDSRLYAYVSMPEEGTAGTVSPPVPVGKRILVCAKPAGTDGTWLGSLSPVCPSEWRSLAESLLDAIVVFKAAKKK